MRKTRLLSILALLLMAAAGAWAQDTYNVTVKEGTEDAAKWSIDPATAEEGQTVTITYSGTKKVKSVKAVKKAAGPTYPIALSAVTNAYIGSVVTTDGNVYATVADATAASKTAVAIIAYVGDAGSVDESSSTYKGLALALTDANKGCKWDTSSSASTPCVSQNSTISTALTYLNGIASTNTLVTDGHTHAAASAARSYSTARPSGVSGWFLPSIGQWNMIVNGLTGTSAAFTKGTTDEALKASAVNTTITAVGGTELQSGYSDGYWSSTEYNAYSVWYYSSNGYASNQSRSSTNCRVRAAFAF